MGQKSCFVAVHFGAGYHSNSKESAYEKLMEKCCTEALYILETTNDLIESLVVGIRILEVLVRQIRQFIKYSRTVEY